MRKKTKGGVLFFTLLSAVLVFGACSGPKTPERAAGGAPPASPPPAPHWITANFHSHAGHGTPFIGDDGELSPKALHLSFRATGVDFNVHTPHSDRNKGPDAADLFVRQAAHEAKFPGTALGEELTVARGPAYLRWTKIAGVQIPGNMNHLGLVGIRRFVSDETPLDRACEAAHRDGGICIVFHPGPGRVFWEPGLWERPGNREHIDALEVYNGLAMAATGIDFEERYREAIAYKGLRLKIAAVSGADTHGPHELFQIRRRLGALVRFMPPAADGKLSEREAVTLVAAREPRLPLILAAVRARRTIATFGLKDLRVACDALGTVHRSRQVAIRLHLDRPVDQVRLWREGIIIREWRDVQEVLFKEEINAPASYSFSIVENGRRAQTSGIWYEPGGVQ